MKKALFIAFHFPPFFGSSGLQRTFCFCRDILKFNWQPYVLTATTGAYEKTSREQLRHLDERVIVVRAFCLDTAKQLSIKGRYPSLFALPDRWISWLVPAVFKGSLLVWRSGIQVIWSTYPIATAHLIGYLINKITRKPWVADFRDPMVEQDCRTGEWYPKNRVLRKIRLSIEKRCVRNAAALVFCTQGAADICVKRYGEKYVNKIHVIPNGYDEESFVIAGEKINPTPDITKIELLHSGLLYPTTDRNPASFFDAVRQLKVEKVINKENFSVIFRASGSEDIYRKMVEERNCDDLIFFEPAIEYKDALSEMMGAGGLLVFQGYTSNPAIPAKIYEYVRAGRPILGLVADEGETKRLIEVGNLGLTANIEDMVSIKNQLYVFLEQIRKGVNMNPKETASVFSRFERARELSILFNAL